MSTATGGPIASAAHPSLYAEPCPVCGEQTIFDGVRRYHTDGFPYVHECETPPPTVPGERDFCATCGSLAWGGTCAGCSTKPAERRRAPVAPPPPRPVVGLDL